ncbi:sigma factor [Streptomyces sp. NPDC057806]|uniref:sigma factor n=1 Tax=Streptomyces sp. NPDC057806 TaxID=3346255 RepID=UPI0036971485
MSLLTTADDQRDRFIGDVYALHGGSTLRYASRLLGGDWYLAEDILQEAVLRAWKHASALGMNASEVRPWLWTTVRHLTIDHHRAERRRPADSTHRQVPVVLRAARPEAGPEARGAVTDVVR